MVALRSLLWVDCSAGFAVGAAGLALTAQGFLGPFLGLPQTLLVVIGCANLLYASFSFTLALSARPRARLVSALVVANLVWSGVCVLMLAACLDAASVFGVSYLMGEAAFVGGLASLEWRAARVYGATA